MNTNFTNQLPTDYALMVAIENANNAITEITYLLSNVRLDIAHLNPAVRTTDQYLAALSA